MPKKWMVVCGIGLVVLVSFFLHFHNATVYQPKYGFDGVGHVYNIEYIAKNWKLPAPESGWETHQSQLYYVIGALLMAVSGTVKTAQYMNTFVLWGIIAISAASLWRVFGRTKPVLIGALALAALPMLNIFPAMVTNELLSTFFMISVAASCVWAVTAKTKKGMYVAIVVGTVMGILGIFTKVSMVTMAPVVLVTAFLLFKKQKNKKKLAFVFFASVCLFLGASYVVFSRVNGTKTPSNLQNVVGVKSTRNPAFFYRMDWIGKIDMYNTQYYSLWGGAYNSFFNDGHNTITPFIKFHKKAFVLWSLGFLLLPLSLIGLVRLYTVHKEGAIVIYTLGISMLMLYVYFNFRVDHYSAVRLTYQMPIVLAYAFGLARVSQMKRVFWPLFFILLLQFSMMASFFWIQPTWHVTR